jgi:sensor domain CHASE-containing protein
MGVAAVSDGERPRRARGLSLQAKVILLVLSLFVLLLGLSAGIQRHFVLPSFLELEHKEARQNLARVMQAIEAEALHLEATASDWGKWTPFWQYMADRDPTFTEENLIPASLSNLRIDLLYVYDNRGALVWGMAVDRHSGERRPMQELDGRDLPPGHPLRPDGSLEQSARGILETEDGPLLVGARAIVTSDGLGPARGLLFFGSILDDETVKTLGERARLDFRLRTLPAGAAERGPLLAGLDPGGGSLDDDEGWTRVRQVLKDLEGRPAELLSMDLPRAVTAQGREATQVAMGLLILAGLATLVALIFSLRRMVLEPTRRLTKHAAQLGREGQPAPIFAKDRRDELGVLAQELNRMVEQLAEARRRLLEQSWNSGAAEMAGGILHNIGNTLTPLGVQGEALRRALDALPMADLRRALEELERPGEDGARRRDLLAFARLAAEETGRGLARAAVAERAMEGQIGHIARILADQERFSRAERVLEPVRLADLLRESAALVPDLPDTRLEIVLGPGIDEAGTAPAACVALQQVFGNLMINAAESVQRAGRPGRLTVSVPRGAERAQDLLHLVFADDGAGIAAADLEHIFARGWSTKTSRRACGLGLHWCSNTLLALGGGILAESAGPGRGAAFHVTIPWPAAAAGHARAERESMPQEAELS